MVDILTADIPQPNGLLHAGQNCAPSTFALSEKTVLLILYILRCWHLQYHLKWNFAENQ